MKREIIHLHPGSAAGPLTEVGRRADDKSRASGSADGPTGELVRFEGDDYYLISSYDRMAPFLMTIASDTDLWMFVTSGGGLTAGRVDADGSLFPYETVDRLHDGHHHTGPITLIRVARVGEDEVLWQPFSGLGTEGSGREHNLYKSTVGNRVVFEEVNRELGLVFRYRWAGCDEFGWVRTATLENRGSSAVSIELLDGLRNVVPSGVSQSLCQHASNLADAYKRSEIDGATGLGIYSLTAGISDRPEAMEILRASVVWSIGLKNAHVHLAREAVDAFRRGEEASGSPVLKGRRGNYLLTSSFDLDPAEYTRWHVVADARRSQSQIAALRSRIAKNGSLYWDVEESLDRAGENLRRIVSSADGMQMTDRDEVAPHHFANVLFNSMRGGVFADNYKVPSADLTDFVRTRNRPVAERHGELLGSLPESLTIADLLEAARNTGDADLERLCHEYLPVYFGRRHGDPSRPWNRFSIHVRNADGSRALRYEGNWRDIFQNWEALCASFPGFLPNVVAKFVNASTVDGFNPYRITRDGVDWETPEPDDPWSHIGYWGDHQIIYLLKLLESMTQYMPGELESLLRRDIFSYADVPYRIKPYEEILRDPSDTITYDGAAAERIRERVREMGTDGRLVLSPDGSVRHVNLMEKLLVPLLSKLSNLVPDGGIWLNTQRPEWNDANNALVGSGVSVVTLCYLRRYVSFLEEFLSSASGEDAAVSTEVFGWFRQIQSVLERAELLLKNGAIGDADRKRVMDELGLSFSDYREQVYSRGFTSRTGLPIGEALDLCRTARAFLDHGIRANRRDDGLYNSYLLLDVSNDGREAALQPLQEMLEGQVAALSSGLLNSEEAASMLDVLFGSPLYREDQNSFMLYPERELPDFLQRNVVPLASARAIPLLDELLDAGDESLVTRDVDGILRFSADFRNGDDTAAALDRLAEQGVAGQGGDGQHDWSASVSRDRDAVLRLFEDVFNHKAYTGRSGAMYAYEGLGSVYWHMVAKLLLAAQEVTLAAETDVDSVGVREELEKVYYRIRAGLGFEKTPGDYGAFPTDPYSHTPSNGGAKQPGMTGQVKEEILTRLGELGVRIDSGVASFQPTLLRPDEFLESPDVFRFYDVNGEAASLEIAAGTLAFTFCQVPVVYEKVDGEGWVRVVLDDGSESSGAGGSVGEGLSLGEELSGELFGRTGRIVRIHVGIPEGTLCGL